MMILRKKRAHPEDSMEWTTDGDTWRQWKMADKKENIEEHYAKKEAEWRLERAIVHLRPPFRNVIEIQRSHCNSVK
jgi:DNA-directed RNA polymerase specialized sigma24 family protein